ncbi:MAG TPA: glycosyltransferase family 4 protein [Vicinamibacterales bacterium]|nr:glycosyltransferase family 4 protein [Vicinamibacterales bacterium]
MRITCLSVSDQLGGSEVALLRIVTALERLHPDWQFQIVLPGNGPLRDSLKGMRAICSVVPMPSALSRLGEWPAVQDGWRTGSRVALGIRLCGAAAVLPAYESRLRRVIADFQPHAIHTNGLKAHVLGARLRTRDAGLVWHLHEYISRRKLTRWLLRQYAGRCSAIVANSASVASDVASSIRPTPDLHVVANPVDLDVFAPTGVRLDVDRLAGLPAASSDVTRVGLIATYARWKGHEVFLDAMKQLASRRSIRGYIIGGPIYDTVNSQFTRTDLQTMIDARELDGCVGLTGFVEPAPAMRALDIIVHASTEPEPFGLVIAEAMACGRAVVTTGSGGAAELIADGHDAIVAPAGEAGALADAIGTLVNNPALRCAIGERARETARARFAPATVASQLGEVFEAISFSSAIAQPA